MVKPYASYTMSSSLNFLTAPNNTLYKKGRKDLLHQETRDASSVSIIVLYLFILTEGIQYSCLSVWLVA